MPKTEMSRFPIHDDLTAPEESLPILKGASSAAGQLPNFLGVLAGAPAALKAYVRFRAELRHGALPRHSAERIGLAVAEHYGSKPGLQLHTRTSRQAGLGIDEVARAKRWDSGDPREAALLRYLRPLLGDRANFPQHLHEEAREAGWSERAAARGDRRTLHGVLHRDGQHRGRRARGRLGRGDPGAARRMR